MRTDFCMLRCRPEITSDLLIPSKRDSLAFWQDFSLFLSSNKVLKLGSYWNVQPPKGSKKELDAAHSIYTSGRSRKRMREQMRNAMVLSTDSQPPQKHRALGFEISYP
jgi:hypothetical protein